MIGEGGEDVMEDIEMWRKRFAIYVRDFFVVRLFVSYYLSGYPILSFICMIIFITLLPSLLLARGMSALDIDVYQDKFPILS